MPIPRRQRGFVAWLAIVALWLTIVAPVVSQTLANPLDSLISIGACGVHHPDGTQTPPTGHLLEKCGYCGMMAGHSMLPDASPVQIPGLALAGPSLTAVRPPERSTIVLLAAAPRGPPVVAHA
ncbi:DUF2946 domain-containing protein [Dyella ginsengisoli]|uniref:DUF2946 domain-containing protein n=1 Tax=Dyella ginsengisoli TaxID=363848 RepID=UPI000349A97E|nr:DUF2946 domain-containing protein [Dyella ginsengisoli]